MTAGGRKSADSDIELRPDGWERFEAAVKAAAKNGPKHRTVSTAKCTKRPRPKTSSPRSK